MIAHPGNIRRRPLERGGFTLVELLVVIGIIATLIAILVPVINAAQHRASRTRIGMELGAIAAALESYRDGYGDYPRSYKIFAGAPADPTKYASTVLSAALLHDPKTQFLAQDKFRESAPLATGELGQLLDNAGNPVGYAPVLKPTSVNLYGSGNARLDAQFFAKTGVAAKDDIKLKGLQYALGDDDRNNKLEGTEKPTFKGGFILYSAGPDGQWFDPAGDPGGDVGTRYGRMDDVYYNFGR